MMLLWRKRGIDRDFLVKLLFVLCAKYFGLVRDRPGGCPLISVEICKPDNVVGRARLPGFGRTLITARSTNNTDLPKTEVELVTAAIVDEVLARPAPIFE